MKIITQIGITILSFALAVGCRQTNQTNDSLEKENNLLAMSLINELNQELEISGKWKTYTGNNTSIGSVDTIGSSSTGWATWIKTYPTISNSTEPDSVEAYSIAEYSNITNTLYTESVSLVYDANNSSGFEYININAASYGKIVWTEIDHNVFFYCNIVYGKTSLQAVKDDPSQADSTNIVTGCNGFPWTRAERY